VNVKANFKSLTDGPVVSGYARKMSALTETDFETLDLVICSFANLNSSGAITGSSFFTNCSTYAINQAHAKGCYVTFSISPSSSYTTACDPENDLYDTIADNIVNIINTYGFDGVDIDWETPTDSQKTWFTSLMRAIYTKVKANNPYHLVTTAIGGGKWAPPKYDLTNSKNYLDYINVMLYGMCSSSGYYQNALYKSSSFNDSTNKVGKTLLSCSVDESMDIFIDTYGVPGSKLIIGVPFYGVRQRRTYEEGVYGAWGDGEGNSASITYVTVQSYIDSGNYTIHYDNVCKVPYLLSNDLLTFVSYENEDSLTEKYNYVIDNDLGGLFFWDNQNDLNRVMINILIDVVN
jgi:chitinase